MNIAREVKSTILTAKDSQSDQASIAMSQFDMSESPFLTAPFNKLLIRNYLRQTFNIANDYALAIPTAGKGVVVLVIKSEIGDTMVEETMNTIADAAKRQLTKRRPGVVCVRFDGLTAAELEEIGAEQGTPSALRIQISRLLDSNGLDHLAWVVFLADGDVKLQPNGSYSREGTSYSFSNKKSASMSDPRLQLF